MKIIFKSLLLLLPLCISGCGSSSSSNYSSQQSNNSSESSGQESYDNEQGLAFYLQNDGTYYVGIGTATCLDEITIPSSYKGKAVTGVLDRGFWVYGSEVGAPVKAKKITIPNSVTYIGEASFEDCKFLEDINIPNSVTFIGEMAFNDNIALKNIIIPDSVKHIGNYAFHYCKALESVSIPSTLEEFGNGVFSECNSLKYNEDDYGYYLGNKNNKYLYLDKTKEKHSLNLNDGCKFISTAINSMNSITINSNVNYSYENGLLIDENKKEIVLLNTNTSGDLVIPNEAKSIRSYAFKDCNLDSITFPFGYNDVNCYGASVGECRFFVTSVEEWLLNSESHYLGPSVRLFKDSDKTEITELIFPDGFTYLSNEYRYYSHITKVVMPKTIINIDYGVFIGCSSITNFTYLGTIEELLDIENFHKYFFSECGTDVIHCSDGDYSLL